MFGWSGFDFEGAATVRPDPDAEAKKEAMDKINEEGKGICSFCGEEIIKNEGGVWESDYLLAWCDGVNKDHKHKPKLVYSLEEGAHNG